MIYLCYGVTKSASTFLYQLTEEVLRAAGRQPARPGPPFRRPPSMDNYLDVIDPGVIETLVAHVGAEADVVLKTHGDLDPGLAPMIADGRLLASASVRDPREIALSMLDHGVRSRRWRYVEFSEYRDIRDTLPALDVQMRRFADWAAVPGTRVFTYNEICFDTAAVAAALAAQLGAAVDVDRVLAPFRTTLGIGQFSKGAALRYREMPASDQAVFLERYADLYAAYVFDTPAAREAARRQGGRAMRARGQVAQFVTQLVRMARR